MKLFHCLKFVFLSIVVALQTFGVHANDIKVTPANAKAGFSITKFKINDDVSGRFDKVEGTLKFDEKNNTISDINVVIDANSINTENEKRDKHLREDKLFFDTAKYKNLKFVTSPGKTFLLSPNKSVAVDGELTIRDQSKKVTLQVTLEKVANGSPVLSAEGQINRKDFGVEWNDDYDGNVIEKYIAKFANKVLAEEVKLDLTFNK